MAGVVCNLQTWHCLLITYLQLARIKLGNVYCRLRIELQWVWQGALKAELEAAMNMVMATTLSKVTTIATQTEMR